MITIQGKHNNPSGLFVDNWELPEDYFKSDLTIQIGDYAVVENYNDYSLVKIIGITETSNKYSKMLTKGKRLKKVVRIIPREEIRAD